MFSIFKKSIPVLSADYFPIVTDIHSHILPGLDDGSPDIATSVELVRGLLKLGVKHSIATPHIIGDLYRNGSISINNSLHLLNTALKENEIDFKVKAAAEYMLDSYFLEILANKIPLLTIKNNMVLTEFSYLGKPTNPEKFVFNLITEGYQPILAHPERYFYYNSNLKEYNYLFELGFLFQINLLSITGYYGKPAAKAAAYLIKNNLVSFAGTDLHHDRHLQALSNYKNRYKFANIFKGNIYNTEFSF